jgi:hypothetical protein
MNRTLSRGLRQVLQLVAGGALTALVNAIADGLAPNTKAIVLACSTLAVVVAQNLLESAGAIATVFEDAHARKAPAPP